MQNLCLILLFSTFLSTFFFKLVNNIFLNFVIERNQKVEKKNQNSPKKKVKKSKINHKFCITLIGRLGISRYLCNPISLSETENISKHYDHNRERHKFAYLKMQLFYALCTCVFHWGTFLQFSSNQWREADLFCRCKDHVSTWRQTLNIFLSITAQILPIYLQNSWHTFY